MNKKILLSLFMLLLFDIAIIALVLIIAYELGINIDKFKFAFFLVFSFYLILKSFLIGFFYWAIIRRGLKEVRKIINYYKKGKFALLETNLPANYLFSELFKELVMFGRYLEDLISTQKNEIEEFRDLYNNILFSVSSYVIALNEDEEVIFANKSFCKNFHYDLDELAGEKVYDLFFFTAGRVADAIENVKTQGGSVILRQVRLLAKNGVAIIADTKISRMTVHGANQIILVMDDVTSKCRKDYQISLISQISESIQNDSEIDRVLHSILTAITSGAGLGFNRAMLFLYDEKKNTLEGKMGVGPDSTEEAVQIWGSVQDGADLLDQIDSVHLPLRSGKNFYEQVVKKSFLLGGNNIFVQTLMSQKNVHIHDAWNDSRVNDEIREFMDVSEFVVVPLVAGNKSIGIIIVDNKYNQSPIWQDNIELLSIFAVQAALSIESCNSLFELRDKMDKITARQDAIVQTEKLAAVGRIAAHIAHEIRNPLITVGGYARRIKQLLDNPSKNSKVLRKSTDIIMHEAERLEKILSNVMDFTRPLPYIRDFNDINEVITDTVEILKNVFQEKKIKCVVDLYEKLPLIKSDFNQLKQVMLNLLQNAMDATPENGKITIKTRVTQSKVKIKVHDNGSGIKDEDLEHLFDPFFTTKVTGVGLGLAIVKKIINDHAGDIKVSNKKSGGAEFVIEFAHSM